MTYSEEYSRHLEQGPFPGRIDPWAEAARYFQQIHGNMIALLMMRLQPRLRPMGYVIAREATLHIAGERKPDLNIQQAKTAPRTKPVSDWSYAAAAAGLQMDVGIEVELDESDLDALYITDTSSGELVTIIEIVSPRNKIEPAAMLSYETRRTHLVRNVGVNVVEIDLTRSTRRLTQHPVTEAVAYHIALHLVGESTRVIGIPFGKPVKPFALPLRNTVIGLELQPVYDEAYRGGIADQLVNEGRYNPDDLPLPSLLTTVQQEEAFATVAVWLKKLNELRAD